MNRRMPPECEEFWTEVTTFWKRWGCMNFSGREIQRRRKEGTVQVRGQSAAVEECDPSAFHPKVAAAFVRLAAKKKTGALICETRQAKRLVFLHAGELVGCRSDVPHERFGSLLLAHSFLTEAQLETAVSYIRSGKKLGEIMVELGYFSAEELSGFVSMQVRNVAGAMLFTEPTRIGFSSTLEIVAVTDKPVSIVEAFLHAASELDNIDTYRGRFETIQGIVSRTRNIVPWYGQLAPEESAVWDVIDGQRTMQDIVAASGLPEEMVLRTLVGFHEFSAVEVNEVVSAVVVSPEFLPDLDFFDEDELVSEPASVVGRIGPTDANVTSSPGLADPSAAHSLPRKPVGTTRSIEHEAPTPQLSAIDRTFLEELHRIKGIVLHGTHWDTLGLAPGAPKTAILSAFHDLCSRFHPDMHLGSGAVSHAPDLNFVFARIHEAFRVLSEEASAKSYSRLIEKEPDYEQERREWSVQPIEATTLVKDPHKAQRLFAMAGEAYQAADYWRTIQLCRMVLEYGENEPDYYYLLGKALSHNPRWRIDAEEHLKIACKLEPWNTRYIIALGELYRREGLDQRAERTFLTAKVIDPDVHIPEAD